MDTRHGQFTSVIVIILLATFSEATFTTDHDGILTSILTGLQTSTRPSDTTAVGLILEMYRITGLDMVLQRYGVSGTVILRWEDSRLAWDKNSFNGREEVYTTASSIWTPVLVLLNSADEMESIKGDTRIPVKIHNAGIVVWAIPVDLLGVCDVDITYYPFDSQTCVYTLSSWLYQQTEVTFSLDEDEVKTSQFVKHGEWELVSSSLQTQTVDYQRMKWSVVDITFNVKRRYTYYIINIVLPVVVLNVLGILVFTLPTESGEKIGYALTILLSLSVVLSVVADSIPTTSLNVCILSIYLMVGFILSALEVVMTVFILKLYSYDDKEQPITSRVQRIARILATISFMQGDQSTEDNIDITSPNFYSSKKGASNAKAGESYSGDKNYEVKNDVKNPISFTQGDQATKDDIRGTSPYLYGSEQVASNAIAGESYSGDKNYKVKTDVKNQKKSIASNKVNVVEALEMNIIDSTEYQEKEECKVYTWKEISNMMDKICLVVFAFITVAYTAVCMMILTIH